MFSCWPLIVYIEKYIETLLRWKPPTKTLLNLICVHCPINFPLEHNLITIYNDIMFIVLHRNMIKTQYHIKPQCSYFCY